MLLNERVAFTLFALHVHTARAFRWQRRPAALAERDREQEFFAIPVEKKFDNVEA
jgi:hypothetical protein